MKKVYPTDDEIFIVRNIKNICKKVDSRVLTQNNPIRHFGFAKIGGVYVEVWKDLSSTTWEINC